MATLTASRIKSNIKTFIVNVWQFITNNKVLTFGLTIFSIILFIAIFADVISPYHYADRNRDCGEDNPYCRYAPPSLKHPFGTNLLGRDMLSRVIYGSRTTLLIAISGTLLAMVIGIPLGILSGYFGGKIDRFLTLIADSIYSLPSLLLAIALAIFFSTSGVLKIIAPVSFATAVVYIPSYFRIIRSQVLQVKEEAYVEAAKSMGAGKLTILLRYITPNVLSSSIAIIPFNMTDAILTNAGLAFLGLGVQPPTPDWGYDVYDARELSKIRLYPWLILFPGLMIFLLSFALSLIGDSLNDKFNPLIREVETK
ncbi:MAG: ABC transporter permease [Candidatus Hodarchaeota archaeon]